MKHKFWYDDKTDIVFQKIIGEYSTEDALSTQTFYKDLLEGKPFKQAIVDVSEGTKLESRETRKIAIKNLDESGLTEVAYIGANATSRIIAKVLMKLGSHKAVSEFFRTEQEAIKWLMDRRKKK